MRDGAQHVPGPERQLRSLIDREKGRGVPSERIVLAGFSQGGAMALHVALRFEEKLAGGSKALFESETELSDFRDRYRPFLLSAPRRPAAPARSAPQQADMRSTRSASQRTASF